MEPLQPVSVSAPGFKGLNKQSSSVDLEPGFALEAVNCVIDSKGRIASRKGFSAVTSSSLGSYDIESIGEYLKIDGSTQIISAANNNLYEGTTTLTSKYSTSVSANRWQMVNFNNFLWLFQSGHAPLSWDGTTMKLITAMTSVAGTPPQGNAVLGAYGRLWVGDVATDKTVLFYSDTLAGQIWTGGASGSIDLKSVWTQGMDSISAVAAFNGYLVIFGRKSILVYSGATNPSSMTLVEHVKGIGCVARDSVQDIGTDLLFLSDTGVRSFQRTIQEKSMPMRDISSNIRNEMLYYIEAETDISKVTSTYNEKERFYLCNFPQNGITFCFDISRVLPNGASPVTTWDTINPKSMITRINGDLLFGQTGIIGKYFGYQDNTSSFDMSYLTAWISFGEPFIQKILKKINFTMQGSSSSVFTVRHSYDYSGSEFTEQQSVSGGTTHEYNVAEYNIAEYSSGRIIDEVSSIGKSAGKMIQVGIFSTVNGAELAIQKFDIYAKRGRMK